MIGFGCQFINSKQLLMTQQIACSLDDQLPRLCSLYHPNLRRVQWLHFYSQPRAMSEIPEDAKPPTPLAPSDLADIVTKASVPAHFTPGLKRVPMYWHPYRTMAKQRWWGREILELVSTEFRDRSIEYYVSRVLE